MNDFRRRLVQRCHAADGGIHPGLLCRIFLYRGGNHARAQRLGEQQAVTGLRSGIAEDVARINQAGDGVSKLHLLVAHAVAADHRAPGFHHLGKAARQNLLEDFQTSLRRKADMRQRRDGPPAHGIDIAQRIGGRDLPENIGIIHHGREEIHGLHQGHIRADLINSGVVGVIETYQDIRICLLRQLFQYRIENRRTQLGGASSGFDSCGQANGGGVRHGKTL